jgi:hypothetical protein
VRSRGGRSERGENDLRGSAARCRRTARLDPCVKGIELYSWRTCSSCEWQFSLLPGTNRSKTAEEVRRPSTAISGVARLEQRLALLAEGEQVFWFHRSLAELAYPEPETIAGIVRFAAERNVRVVVPR